MKMTLNTSQAVDALRRDQYAGWSYKGAIALVEYLEQYEQDLGEQVELDVVAIRCDFSEYSSALEAAIDNGYNEGDSTQLSEDSEVDQEAALEYLQEHTTVIEFDGGVIIQNY